MTHATPRAVIWDMDGTLIDSAEYHWLAWHDQMADEGYALTHDEFVATFGQRNDTILRGYDDTMHVETRDWGESVDLGDGLQVHLTPANHWSARGVNDRRMALWCAFVLTSPMGVHYHVGDTGLGDGTIFREVRARFGAPRLATLPIAAYEPRWFMQPQHMNPEDAVAALGLLGAEQALGHHWGTFRLTDEGVERLAQALDAALDGAGLPRARFLALRPGQVWQAEG